MKTNPSEVRYFNKREMWGSIWCSVEKGDPAFGYLQVQQRCFFLLSHLPNVCWLKVSLTHTGSKQAARKESNVFAVVAVVLKLSSLFLRIDLSTVQLFFDRSKEIKELFILGEGAIKERRRSGFFHASFLRKGVKIRSMLLKTKGRILIAFLVLLAIQKTKKRTHAQSQFVAAFGSLS